MKKLKLNIQKFASTNSTTHYNLSQYIATDKPTYLVDYNGDMLKIDTAIYNAMSKANDNETHIGTMNNLNTTEKSNLVGAINEVNTQVGTNTSDIAQNTLDISANSTKIGTLADLSTTYKTNIVGAINEVKAEANTNRDNIDKFNLTHFDTYSDSDFTKSNITSMNAQGFTVATNEDGSIFKVYGQIVCQKGSGNASVSIQTRIRPTSNLTIAFSGMSFWEYSNANFQRGSSFSIDTNGILTIEINSFGSDPTQETIRKIYFPCLYFAKDFGDTPVNV